MADFTKSELKRAKRAKEEELYVKEGYKKAVILGRSFSDYENHLFAFLIDLNICLIPVYAWGVEFILILTGVIPPAYFDLLFYLMYGLLFITSCIMLPMYTAKTDGYSWGGRFMGLRLVRPDRLPAQAIRLVLRQLFGFGIPMMLFGYFFSAFGMVGWWLLSGLITLISPGQRSLADWIFGLVLVYVPRYELKIRSKDAYQKETSLESSPFQDSLNQPENNFPTDEPDHDANEGMKTSSSTSKHMTKPTLVAYEKVNSENGSSLEENEEGKEMDPSVHDEDFSDQEEGLELSKIDLHIRSSYSDDANAEVENIFREAKRLGLDCISITDHNNARSNSEANIFSRMYKVNVIPGVELDCEIFGERVRILGYYIDWNDQAFTQLENASLERERKVSEKRMKKFENELGIKINSEALLANTRFKIIRPHELTDLVFDTEATRRLPTLAEYLQKYPTEEQARKHFSRDYFGPGGKCEIKATYPQAKEIINIIKNAGGIPILSGWHLDHISDDAIESLIDDGIEGFEVFTPNNSESIQAFLLTLAKREGLYVTGGSDYHGAMKRDRYLGYTTAPKGADAIIRPFTMGLNVSQDILDS